MPRAHPKLTATDAIKIKEGQSLLSVEDREKVLSIIEFAKEIKKEAEPLLKTRLEMMKQHVIDNANQMRLSEECENIQNMKEDIEFINMPAVLSRILEYSEEGIINAFPDCKTIEELITHLNLDKKDLDSEESKAKLTSVLEEYYNELSPTLSQLNDKCDQFIEKEYEIEEKLSVIKDKFIQYQQDKNLVLDLDEDFNLTKISKKNNGPEFSVVIADHNGDTKPFILYRGKHYEGKERMLGKGGFGIVKLAQDFNDHNLVAVKIQDVQFLPEEAYLKEKNILDEFGRLKGALKRMDQNKDYTILSLHYGKDLEKYVESANFGDVEAINIITQMVDEVHGMHLKDLIHRDIKLENFMWDPFGNQLDIIDFGFVKSLNGHPSITTRDEAGSDGYIAPEAVDKGIYSKKSDFYAFGITVQNLLSKNHPELYQKIKPQVEALLNEDPKLRTPSLLPLKIRLRAIQKQYDAQVDIKGKDELNIDTRSSLSAERNAEIKQIIQAFVQYRCKESIVQKKIDEIKEKHEQASEPIAIKVRN